MRTYGDNDSAGAIFVFKDDGTDYDALAAAAKVAQQHRVDGTYTATEKERVVATLGYDPTDATGRFVYVVHTTDREEFVAELSAWCVRTDGRDRALLIYAHMGGDIGPVDDKNVPGVEWRELAETLGAVSSLWLAGCDSQQCLDAWATAPALHPVSNWVVCTNSSIYWQPLIKHFVNELSLTRVYMPEEIARDLKAEFGGEARVFQREDRWVAVDG